MLKRLITLFCIIALNSFATTDAELRDFSKSPKWLKYLQFKNNKSKIKGNRFFLSKEGAQAPYKELVKSFELFKKNFHDENGINYKCLFPARFRLLKEALSYEFEDVFCTDYENWLLGLDAGDAYLVFASSYPNNPASMFGHTYLRFDRESRQSSASKKLSGYSFSFQATTNPNDNPFVYTYKGILGGYYAHLQIKPHYIDIGIYNNAESRNMWETKIELSESEKITLLAYAWELSISGAFSYYFFDENCSTLILSMLEVVRPHINFKTAEELFVVPQVSYREITKYFGANKSILNLSLQVKVNIQYENLSDTQKKEFKKIKSGHRIDNPSASALDVSNDWWRLKFYKEKSQLSEDEKEHMKWALYKRASMKEITQYDFKVDDKENERPEFGHQMSLLGIGFEKQLMARVRYGFHDFNDPKIGYGDNSYIKFFDFHYFKDKKRDMFSTELINILSLSDIRSVFPTLSWQVRAGHEYQYNSELFIDLALGISTKNHIIQSYFLIHANYNGSIQSRPFFSFEYNNRLDLTDSIYTNFGLSLDLLEDEQTLSEWVSLSYYQSQKSISLKYTKNKLSINLGYYY